MWQYNPPLIFAGIVGLLINGSLRIGRIVAHVFVITCTVLSQQYSHLDRPKPLLTGITFNLYEKKK